MLLAKQNWEHLLFYLQMRYVVQNGPGFNVFALFIDVMVIDRMKHKRQRFQKYQNAHDIMDPENSMPMKACGFNIDTITYSLM